MAVFYPKEAVMKTINQQLWSKEVRRIRNFIKRASKRGFEFDANIIPEMPKRVTKKALQELRRQTTPNRIYMRSYLPFSKWPDNYRLKRQTD